MLRPADINRPIHWRRAADTLGAGSRLLERRASYGRERRERREGRCARVWTEKEQMSRRGDGLTEVNQREHSKMRTTNSKRRWMERERKSAC
jgi:hypothetical protein